MNLTSPSQVRGLIDQLGMRPSRTMGQNFLIDHNILDILIAAAALQPADSVLEVGPGLGVVTEQLVARTRQVVAVEKDRRLHAHLVERFAGVPNLRLIGGDALDVDVEALLGGGLNKVVSNLPYSVGSRVLVNLVRAAHAPALIVVTVQREVADRLVAAVGSGDYGLLSVWVQLDYDVERVKTVGPACFWPAPEVSSAIVRMVKRPAPARKAPAREAFHTLTKQAFSARRKQVAAILRRLDPGGAAAAEDLLRATGIDPAARPENLSPGAWFRLAEGWGSMGRAEQPTVMGGNRD